MTEQNGNAFTFEQLAKEARKIAQHQYSRFSEKMRAGLMTETKFNERVKMALAIAEHLEQQAKKERLL